MLPIIVVFAALLFLLKCKDALVDRATRDLMRDARRGRSARNFLLCAVGLFLLYCAAGRKQHPPAAHRSPAAAAYGGTIQANRAAGNE